MTGQLCLTAAVIWMDPGPSCGWDMVSVGSGVRSSLAAPWGGVAFGGIHTGVMNGPSRNIQHVADLKCAVERGYAECTL